MICGEFTDFGTAFYHSAVNYTSLGYGDLIDQGVESFHRSDSEGCTIVTIERHSPDRFSTGPLYMCPPRARGLAPSRVFLLYRTDNLLPTPPRIAPFWVSAEVLANNRGAKFTKTCRSRRNPLSGNNLQQIAASRFSPFCSLSLRSLREFAATCTTLLLRSGRFSMSVAATSSSAFRPRRRAISASATF